MPDPIGPAPAPVSTCDPELASCLDAEPAVSSRVITLPPVVIEGRAQPAPPGRHEAPSCKTEADAATQGCVTAVIAGAGTLAAAPTGAGLIVGAAATINQVTSCQRLIAAYDDCKTVGAARADAANQCEARGGTPFSGIEKTEIICLVTE